MTNNTYLHLRRAAGAGPAGVAVAKARLQAHNEYAPEIVGFVLTYYVK